MKDADTTRQTGKTSESPDMDWSAFDAMTDEERHQAALLDPDAQPMTDVDWARMKRTPQVKIIRRAFRLTQEEFSARYRIPLPTLQDWEEGKSEPDETVRAYLRVIAHDPEGVLKALHQKRA